MPALPSLADLGKLVEKFKLPGIDVNAIVESQRKDMEALAEANRQAYEGIKALAQRRNEILQEALVQWQDAMKDATGKDALSKRAEMAKKGVQQAIANFPRAGRDGGAVARQGLEGAAGPLPGKRREPAEAPEAEVTRRRRRIDRG
jgi:uncharacterized protein YigA (DUF484 family)